MAKNLEFKQKNGLCDNMATFYKFGTKLEK